MQFINHRLKFNRIVPVAFIIWNLGLQYPIPSKRDLLLLGYVLIRNNNALFYFLVLNTHPLNVLTHLVNSAPETLVHLMVASDIDCLSLLHNAATFNLCFDVLAFVPQQIKLLV
jgi:hypothetical protein